MHDVVLLQGLVLDCSPLDWEALERLPPADSFPLERRPCGWRLMKSRTR